MPRMVRDAAYSNAERERLSGDLLEYGFVVRVRDAIEIDTSETIAVLGDDIVRTWYGASAGPSCVVMWQTLANATDSGLIQVSELASTIGMPVNKTNRNAQCLRTMTRMLAWMPLARVSLGVIEMPDAVRFPHPGQVRKWSKLNKLEHARWAARNGYTS